MSPKNILVSLNDTENIDYTLKTACALALKHDAHLIGVYVVPSFQLSMGLYGSDAVMLDLQYSELKKYKQIAKDMTEKFDSTLKSNQVLGKTRIVNSDNSEIAEEFIDQAHTADLIIIPRVDAEKHCNVEHDFAEKVVQAAGRPVILLPRQVAFENIGDRVSIGWNLTAESSRASFDALPLLSAGAEIRFVWIDAHRKLRDAGSLPGAEIAEAFSHYGLDVIADSIESGDGNIGKALLNDAKINGSDLMVMGAYGHSRLREFIFGGATKYVFEHMDLPVLMSR